MSDKAAVQTEAARFIRGYCHHLLPDSHDGTSNGPSFILLYHGIDLRQHNCGPLAREVALTSIFPL